MLYFSVLTIPSDIDARRNAPNVLHTLRNRLVAFSKANRFLQFEANGISSFDEPQLFSLVEGLWQEELAFEDVIDPDSKWIRIRRAAFRAERELGYQSLSIGLGKLTWQTADGSEFIAPLFLIPLDVHMVRRLGIRTMLKSEGQVEVNPVLAAYLHTELQREVNLHSATGLALADAFQNLIHQFEHQVPEVTFQNDLPLSEMNWHLTYACVLDNFTTGNQGLFRAYQHLSDGFFQEIDRQVAPTETSNVHIADTTFVLPFDASQAKVIRASFGNSRLFLHGPPGTGKSQTITNIVAAHVAEGKRVALISTKLAALNAVYERLTRVGLGCLALKYISPEREKSEVVQQLVRSLDALEGLDDDLSALESRKRALTAQVKVKLESLEKRSTMRQVMPEIADVVQKRMHLDYAFPTASPTYTVPSIQDWEKAKVLVAKCWEVWRNGQPSGFSDILLNRLNPAILKPEATDVESICTQLDKDASALHETFEGYKYWSIRELALLADWLDEASKLADAGLEKLAIHSSRKAHKLGALFHDLQEINSQLETLESSYPALLVLFTHEQYAYAVQQFQKTGIGSLNLSRRKIIGRVKKAIAQLDAPVSVTQYFDLLARAHALLLQKKQLESQLQHLSPTSVTAETIARIELCHRLSSSFRATDALSLLKRKNLLQVRPVFTRFRNNLHLAFESSGTLTLGEVRLLIDEVQKNMSIISISRSFYSQLYQEHPEVLRFLKAANPSSLTHATAMVYDAALMQVIMHTGDYGIASGKQLEYHLSALHDVLQELAQVNSRLILMKKAREWGMMKRIISKSSSSIPPEKREWRKTVLKGFRILRREAAKSRNNASLLALMKSGVWEAAQALMPVVITTPEGLVNGFDPSMRFNLLIVDEAGIVPLEAAVPCAARADNWLISGDPMQMSPTAFFKRNLPEEQEELPATILDLAAARFPSFMLNVHYRSADPALMKYLNHHFYEEKLRLLPGGNGHSPFEMHRVQGVFANGVNVEEAGMMAHKMRELLIDDPDCSICVVAMSQRQLDAIEDAVYLLMDSDPIFTELWYRSRREGVLFRSLENLQGDERDVLLVGLGYAAGAEGNLRLNFGLLIREGGERRLNVLFSRARKKIVVYHSFNMKDLPVSTNPGIHHLKGLLAYMADAGTSGDAEQAVLFHDPMVHGGWHAIDLSFAVLPTLRQRKMEMRYKSILDILQ